MPRGKLAKEGLVGEVLRLRMEGLGPREITRQLQERGFSISHQAVSSFISRRKLDGLILLRSSFERRFVEEAQKRGYSVVYKGWPDFCVFGKGHVFFVEVKNRRSGRNHLTSEQQFLLGVLSTRFPYFVSYDGDWPEQTS